MHIWNNVYKRDTADIKNFTCVEKELRLLLLTKVTCVFTYVNLLYIPICYLILMSIK